MANVRAESTQQNSSKFEIRHLRLVTIWVAVPATYLLALVLSLRGYFTGTAVPPGDFVGGGFVETFRWYQDGSFVDPPTWFPYGWFGVPEHQLLQNAGWVIPIAFMAEVLGWNFRTATLAQASFIWMGGIGAFLLAKSLRVATPMAALTGFIYLLTITAISNAQHSSIIRAGALLPFLMICLVPRFVKFSIISVPLISLIVWQFLVAGYPGNLVSAAYVLIATFVFVLLAAKPRSFSQYVLRIFLGFSGGALLASPRLLPVILERSNFPTTQLNKSPLTLDLLPTLLMPFSLDGLPNDPSMRSIWLAPVVIALITLINLKDKLQVFLLALTVSSILAMTELNLITAAKDFLPFGRLSAWPISDWRPILGLSTAVLTGLILQNYLNRAKNHQPIAPTVTRISAAALFGAVIYATSPRIYFDDWFSTALISLFFLTVGVCCLLLVNAAKVTSWLVTITFCLLTFASYLLITESSSLRWQTDRKIAENLIFGQQISQIQDDSTWPMRIRPGRVFFDFPPLDYTSIISDFRYNRFWLQGDVGGLGYHNVWFSPRYVTLIEQMYLDDSAVIVFLAGPSRALLLPETAQRASDDQLFACVKNEKACNTGTPNTAASISFDKASEVLMVEAQERGLLVQNEVYQRGWVSNLCTESGCTQGPAATPVNDVLRGWALPAGKYELRTKYQPPGGETRWLLFAIGLFTALATPLFYLILSRRPSVRKTLSYRST